MKIMKVFDCQEMPDDVRSEFFGWAEQGNDCYVKVFIEPYEKLEDDTLVYSPLVTWLMKNGAELQDKEVIISHWW